jgi:hypothetical protein
VGAQPQSSSTVLVFEKSPTGLDPDPTPLFAFAGSPAACLRQLKEYIYCGTRTWRDEYRSFNCAPAAPTTVLVMRSYPRSWTEHFRMGVGAQAPSPGPFGRARGVILGIVAAFHPSWNARSTAVRIAFDYRFTRKWGMIRFVLTGAGIVSPCAQPRSGRCACADKYFIRTLTHHIRSLASCDRLGV